MTIINTNSSNKSHTITGLTNGVTYRIRVAAVNSVGVGPFTEYIYATPSLSSTIIDDYFYNTQLLLDMDKIAKSDEYYGNSVFILGTQTPGPDDDPYSLQTSLLLHGDGIALTDSSIRNRKISTNGTAPVQTISDSKFGTGSLSFNGSNALTIAHITNSVANQDMIIGTNDFTVELFIKFRTINPENPIFIATSNNESSLSRSWLINYSSSANGLLLQNPRWNFGWYYETASTPWSPSTDVWYHIAILRQSGTIKMFIDGIEKTVSDNRIFASTSFGHEGFSIGRMAGFGGFDGQIDEFRFTNGIARDITLPTSAYPNPLNPFKDLSPSPKSVFISNNASVFTYQELSAPADIIPFQPESGSLTLSWTNPTPPGSDYIVQYSNDGGINWTTVNNGAYSSTNNSITVNSLPDGSYSFRVASINGDLQSPWASIEVDMPLRGESIQYLVVAGGGGGGSGIGGGGGGGGLRTSRIGSASGGLAHTERLLFLAANVEYPVVVGAGGAGASAGSDQPNGSDGGSSYLADIISVGGGGGASQFNEDGGRSGSSGGSGGGGTGRTYTFSARNGGRGTPNQGFSGGSGGTQYYTGGGGGAGGFGAGTPGHADKATGGGGAANDIIGAWYYWAGGGGGSGYNSGNGGNGGGGGGAIGQTSGGYGLNRGSPGGGGNIESGNTPGGDGGTNTGGGGGGGGGVISDQDPNNYGGSGGSGIVIIRSSNKNATTTGSPEIITVGSETVYIFRGTGSIKF